MILGTVSSVFLLLFPWFFREPAQRQGGSEGKRSSEVEGFEGGLMSDWAELSPREAARRAREMARFRRWAASATGGNRRSTWNSGTLSASRPLCQQGPASGNSLGVRPFLSSVGFIPKGEHRWFTTRSGGGTDRFAARYNFPGRVMSWKRKLTREPCVGGQSGMNPSWTAGRRWARTQPGRLLRQWHGFKRSTSRRFNPEPGRN